VAAREVGGRGHVGGDVEGWVGRGGEVGFELLLVEALGGGMGEEEGRSAYILVPVIMYAE
jgi:hypothetical protein